MGKIKEKAKKEMKWYVKYFSYRPSTFKIIDKKFIGISEIKELYKTLKSGKTANYTYEQSLQKEGIVEEDLPEIYKKFKTATCIMLILSIYPVLNISTVLYRFFKGEIFTYGFLPTLFPGIAALIIIFFFYMLMSWFKWKIRNKMLLAPIDFIKISLKYPKELLPNKKITESMDNSYDKNWLDIIKKNED